MDELLVRIESLSYGVFGVARTERGTVLVAGTAPGDVARVRVVADKRGYREAEVLELVAPSPLRRTPPCRYVPECGGCTWQHVGYDAQLAAKQSILQETLARVGGFPPDALDIGPILPSAEWGYRHRVTLRVDGEHRLGFYRHRSHRLVEIESCAIANDALNANLATARRWLRGVSTTVRRLEVACAAGDRVVFSGNAEGPYRHDAEYHERFLERHPHVAGIVLFGKGWRRSFGKARASITVDENLHLETEGGFSQVNPAANRRLVEVMLALATPRPTDRVLDLYCGSGNLTLPLARRTREVVGVESDSPSVTSARRNADRWGIRNCRFVQGRAAAVGRGFAAGGERFDLVVLDPPRSGAAEVVEAVAAVAADRVVYVSCDPVTLARDLRRLVELGLALGPVRPIDFFPQTFHLETVARLDRRASPPLA